MISTPASWKELRVKQMRLCCLVLLSVPLWAQPAPPAKSACQPCTLQPGRDQPTFTITLHPSSTPGKHTADAELIVNRDGKEVQRLSLQDAGPLQQDQASAFLGVDLNFDSLLDLQVITSQGVANGYADDWLYKPAEKRFVYLGNYPVFTPDPATHTLKTYERNGEGGMSYAAKVYAFSGDRLLLVRSEVQEETTRDGVFRLTVKERIQGVLKVTSHRLVRASAAPK